MFFLFHQARYKILISCAELEDIHRIWKDSHTQGNMNLYTDLI